VPHHIKSVLRPRIHNTQVKAVRQILEIIKSLADVGAFELVPVARS